MTLTLIQGHKKFYTNYLLKLCIGSDGIWHAVETFGLMNLIPISCLINIVQRELVQLG